MLLNILEKFLLLWIDYNNGTEQIIYQISFFCLSELHILISKIQHNLNWKICQIFFCINTLVKIWPDCFRKMSKFGKHEGTLCSTTRTHIYYSPYTLHFGRLPQFVGNIICSVFKKVWKPLIVRQSLYYSQFVLGHPV